jgi:hypothetical protein
MIGERGGWMTSDYPRDCLAGAVLDGPSLDAPDEDEADEAESGDAAIGYGSLLSLGATIRKKQPLIVVDPVEAENEARRVQHIAAQQLAGHEETDGLDFLTSMPELIEAAVAHPDEPQPGAVEVDDQVGADEGIEETAGGPPGFAHALEDAAGDTDALRVDEAPAEAEPFPGPLEDPVEAAEYDVAGDEGQVDPAPTGASPESLDREPDAAQTTVRHQGHSLRARVPTRQARKTLLEHLASFGKWLYEWLTRDRA